MQELNRIDGTRIVAKPAALDAVSWPDELLVLRIAADEVYIAAPPADLADVDIDDPFAIVIGDGTFSGMWMDEAEGLATLEQTCEWELPQARPAFAQGMVAGIPAKLWFDEDAILFIVPTPYWVEFTERVGH